jgi:hypothetical protein
VLGGKIILGSYNPKSMDIVKKITSEKTNRSARLTLKRSDLGGKVLRRGFRQSS